MTWRICVCLDKSEFDGGAPVISYAVQGKVIGEGTQNTCTQCVRLCYQQTVSVCSLFTIQRSSGQCLALLLILKHSVRSTHRSSHLTCSPSLCPRLLLALTMSSESAALTKLGSVIFAFTFVYMLFPNCAYLLIPVSLCL